jgi:hypothetical protein|tara:strand:- start:468 stop:590 length:123 start_codon:yes stop_codon:yes gene_type:complete
MLELKEEYKNKIVHGFNDITDKELETLTPYITDVLEKYFK